MATTTIPNPNPTKVYYTRSNTSMQLDRMSFDQQYLDRLCEGEPETALHFTRYFTRLLLMKLRSRFRASYQADDVAQETLLRVVKQLRERGGIDHPERLGAFVHSVCDHVVLEFFRAGNRYQQIPENAPEPVSQAVDAEEGCITEERKALIFKAMGQLRKEDQTIIQKVFLLEQDKDQICRELGVTRNYLRVRVFRSIAHFRQVLNSASSAPKAKKAASN